MLFALYIANAEAHMLTRLQAYHEEADIQIQRRHACLELTASL